MRYFSLCLSASLVFAADAPLADIDGATVAAFHRHILGREAQLKRDRFDGGKFLWLDEDSRRVDRIRRGEIVTEAFSGRGAHEVKGGLIHDWIGAVFIPKTTLHKTLRLVQDYDNHKNIYRPEVSDSRLLQRSGNDFKIQLRLVKKRVITVVLNTEHDVRYTALDPSRVHSRSYSTRISELDDPGTAREKELPPGKDHGFLWRLYSYWRFHERDGGVYVECEAISLTRGIPLGLGLIVGPIIRELPRESLENTLQATRAAAGG